MKKLFLMFLLSYASNYASRQLTPHQQQALEHIALLAQAFDQHAQEKAKTFEQIEQKRKRALRTAQRQEKDQKNNQQKEKNHWKN